MNLKNSLLGLSTVCAIGTIGSGIAAYNATPKADEFAAATDPNPNLDDPKSVEQFLRNVSTPCSPKQQALLDEADAIIISHQEQIGRWYNAICQNAQNNGELQDKCPPLPQALFDSYKDNSLKRRCAKNNLATADAGAVTVKEHNLISIFPNTFSESIKRGDVCLLVETDVHERLHAVADLSLNEAEKHNELGVEGNMDPVYLAGAAAQIVCIDSKSQPNPDDTETNRYTKAAQIYLQRNQQSLARLNSK